MVLTVAEGLDGDCVFALARTPKAAPKHKFLMLMRDELLTGLTNQICIQLEDFDFKKLRDGRCSLQRSALLTGGGD